MTAPIKTEEPCKERPDGIHWWIDCCEDCGDSYCQWCYLTKDWELADYEGEEGEAEC